MDDLIKKITEQQKEVVRSMIKKERRGRSSAVSVGSGQSQAYTEFQMKKNQADIDKIPDLETSISGNTSEISNLKTRVTALEQNVGASVNAELVKLRNNLKNTDLNLMKNTLNDRIYREKEDPTKPIAQMNNFVADTLSDGEGLDEELSVNCFFDGSSGTIKSTTAVNKRPIFKIELQSNLLNNDGTLFCVPQKITTPWSTINYVEVYLLTSDMRLLKFTDFGNDINSISEVQLTHSIEFPQISIIISGAYAHSENKYYFTTNAFSEFCLLYIDMDTFTVNLVEPAGSSPENMIDGGIIWWDSNYNVLAFNGGYSNNGDFFIYNPTSNSMIRDYQGMFQLDETTPKAFDPVTNKFIHFIDSDSKVYQYFVANGGTRIVTNYNFVGGVVPFISNAKCFIKDNKLMMMCPDDYKQNVYQLNLTNNQFSFNTDFVFVGRKVADYPTYFGYFEILKDENGNTLTKPIRTIYMVNMVNSATNKVDNSINTWRFKHTGTGEYNPNDPANQTPWIFVSKALTTSKSLNWAYGLITAYANQYGQLVGIYFSRNNGITWSSLSNAEDLVNISTQPTGQSLRIKIAAKHDYEIIAFAFGGME